MEQEVFLDCDCGRIRGLDNGRCRVFLGLRYARAERFCYAEPVEHWDGVFDATKHGAACPQNRAVHEHLENPTRRFYKREYREGLPFTYDEDCLNLNLFVPYHAKNAPVIVFFYGGGFDSGINWESPFDGSSLAERGVITVFANYRVGVLGYLTHDQIQKETGRDGNFGLDDQLTALRWVKKHIKAFGGDPEKLTLMGQSAGAISVQYLCLNPENRGLFQRAILLSGAGKFPKFAQPRPCEQTRGYWLQFMELAGCKSLDELRKAPLDALFEATEKIRSLRKDNTYCTMPVIDGALIPASPAQLFRNPLPLDYIIGYTNADMFAPILARIGNRFGRSVGAYIYYFDLDAPGDDNRAFHSSDLRYVFGTLQTSWRPYGKRDYAASKELLEYLAAFAEAGDPNRPCLPVWRKAGSGFRTAVLHIAPDETRMGHTAYCKLLRNFLRRGDPIG